eukprot:g4583.t1
MVIYAAENRERNGASLAIDTLPIHEGPLEVCDEKGKNRKMRWCTLRGVDRSAIVRFYAKESDVAKEKKVKGGFDVYGAQVLFGSGLLSAGKYQENVYFRVIEDGQVHILASHSDIFTEKWAKALRSVASFLGTHGGEPVARSRLIDCIPGRQKLPDLPPLALPNFDGEGRPPSSVKASVPAKKNYDRYTVTLHSDERKVVLQPQGRGSSRTRHEFHLQNFVCHRVARKMKGFHFSICFELRPSLHFCCDSAEDQAAWILALKSLSSNRGQQRLPREPSQIARHGADDTGALKGQVPTSQRHAAPPSRRRKRRMSGYLEKLTEVPGSFFGKKVIWEELYFAVDVDSKEISMYSMPNEACVATVQAEQGEIDDVAQGVIHVSLPEGEALTLRAKSTKQAEQWTKAINPGRAHGLPAGDHSLLQNDADGSASSEMSEFHFENLRARGQGMHEAIAGEIARFAVMNIGSDVDISWEQSVHASLSMKDPLVVEDDVEKERDAASAVHVDLQPDRGSLRASFRVNDAGLYYLSVTWNETHIFGSPFRLAVSPARADPARSFIEGEGLKFAIPGTPTTVMLHTVDSYGNHIGKGGEEVTVLCANSNDCAVIDLEDGTYECRFSIPAKPVGEAGAEAEADANTNAGTYPATVSIQIGGKNVAGSPFSPGTDAAARIEASLSPEQRPTPQDLRQRGILQRVSKASMDGEESIENSPFGVRRLSVGHALQARPSWEKLSPVGVSGPSQGHRLSESNRNDSMAPEEDAGDLEEATIEMAMGHAAEALRRTQSMASRENSPQRSMGMEASADEFGEDAGIEIAYANSSDGLFPRNAGGNEYTISEEIDPMLSPSSLTGHAKVGQAARDVERIITSSTRPNPDPWATHVELQDWILYGKRLLDKALMPLVNVIQDEITVGSGSVGFSQWKIHVSNFANYLNSSNDWYIESFAEWEHEFDALKDMCNVFDSSRTLPCANSLINLFECLLGSVRQLLADFRADEAGYQASAKKNQHASEDVARVETPDEAWRTFNMDAYTDDGPMLLNSSSAGKTLGTRAFHSPSLRDDDSSQVLYNDSPSRDFDNALWNESLAMESSFQNQHGAFPGGESPASFNLVDVDYMDGAAYDSREESNGSLDSETSSNPEGSYARMFQQKKNGKKRAKPRIPRKTGKGKAAPSDQVAQQDGQYRASPSTQQEPRSGATDKPDMVEGYHQNFERRRAPSNGNNGSVNRNVGNGVQSKPRWKSASSIERRSRKKTSRPGGGNSMAMLSKVSSELQQNQKRVQQSSSEATFKNELTGLSIGQEIQLKSGKRGTIRFLGQTSFAAGSWVGIELFAAVGRNNGTVKGVQYFSCKPLHGIFVRSSSVAPSFESWHRVHTSPLKNDAGPPESRETGAGAIQPTSVKQPEPPNMEGGGSAKQFTQEGESASSRYRTPMASNSGAVQQKTFSAGGSSRGGRPRATERASRRSGKLASPSPDWKEVSAKGEGEDDSELLNKIKDGLEYVMKMQQLGSPRGGKVQASATVAEIGKGPSKRTSLPKSAKRVEKKVVRKPKVGENQQQTEEFLSKLGLGRHIPKMRGYGFTNSMQALAALENTQLLALELAPRDQSAMLGAIAALRAKLLIQRRMSSPPRHVHLFRFCVLLLCFALCNFNISQLVLDLDLAVSDRRKTMSKLQRLPAEVNKILYVKNLPFTISGEEMYRIFGQYGKIRQIRLGDAHSTRGTAFVVFEDIFCAKNA